MNVVSLVLIVSCFTMLVTVMGVSFSEVSSSTTRPMITFDKITYTWTDKVYITVLAPDYNLDSDTIDEIGNTVQNPVNISTGNHTLNQYKLTETGPDTGVFVGEVTLTGFKHDVDGYKDTGDENGYDTCPHTGDSNGVRIEPRDLWGSYQCSYTSNGMAITVGLGPTNGFLENTNDDTITVSFKFSKDDILVKSAPIKWTVGQIHQLIDVFYSLSGDSIGVFRIIDPDMNLDPESVDTLEVTAWSIADTGGVDWRVSETGNATGIFEGKQFIDIGVYHSGHSVFIGPHDTIFVEYNDHTLPPPYDISDDLYILDSHIVKKKPLTRASITNFRIIDSTEYFPDVKDYPIVNGKPAYLTADIQATQDYVNEECVFITQIENANNEVVHLEINKHSLNERSERVANLWIPDMPGTYTVTAFIWKSIDNPVPLSPKMETTVLVTPALSEN